MYKSARHTWAVGTAATGVVLSIAGLGAVSMPAWGSTPACAPSLVAQGYLLEPVSNYHDTNNPDSHLWADFDASQPNPDGYICFKWTKGLPDTYDAGEKGVLKND